MVAHYTDLILRTHNLAACTPVCGTGDIVLGKMATCEQERVPISRIIRRLPSGAEKEILYAMPNHFRTAFNFEEARFTELEEENTKLIETLVVSRNECADKRATVVRLKNMTFWQRCVAVFKGIS